MDHNCPNCGAPIVSVRCSYCGTIHRDFMGTEIGILKSKQEALRSNIRLTELYDAAIRAMRNYKSPYEI